METMRIGEVVGVEEEVLAVEVAGFEDIEVRKLWKWRWLWG